MKTNETKQLIGNTLHIKPPSSPEVRPTRSGGELNFLCQDTRLSSKRPTAPCATTMRPATLKDCAGILDRQNISILAQTEPYHFPV